MLVANRNTLRILVVLVLVTLALIFFYHDRIPEDIIEKAKARFDVGSWRNAQEHLDFLASEHAQPDDSGAQNVADLENHSDSVNHHFVGEFEVVDSVDHESNYTPEDTDKRRVIYSVSTKDKKYFSVDFGGASTYNVNILVHPTEPDKYIVVAQSIVYRNDIGASEEFYCIAHFLKGVLHCPKPPDALPLAQSIEGKCDDEWGYTNMRHGPRDARAFYGPGTPYIIYGQQSSYTCLGLWVQDLRLLIDGVKHPKEGWFRGATELRRPEPWGQIEKNYLLFWDSEDNVYAHYNIWPQRAFSRLHHDGTPHSIPFGDWIDLAKDSEEQDSKCMAKYMPKMPDSYDESIHQATNSISITLCKKSDPNCTVTDDNTFIMIIFQHKSYYDGHGLYEPYVALFHRTAPFAFYGIGTKSLWINGRDKLTDKTQSRLYTTNDIVVDAQMPDDHTEMFYVTSISWKGHGQTYHGFLDDVMFVGFGIEDTRSAAIDVLAADMVQDLGLC